MFLASKFLSFLTQPLVWAALPVLACVLLIKDNPRWTFRLGATALGMLLLLGWEPLPNVALRYLEAQYPAATQDHGWQEQVGVILLGGALRPAYAWTVQGHSALNDAAERMTEVAPLLRRDLHLQVLYTGGEGELFGTGASEAERSRRFFQAQGVSPD